jgi:hypothetical protein
MACGSVPRLGIFWERCVRRISGELYLVPPAVGLAWLSCTLQDGGPNRECPPLVFAEHTTWLALDWVLVIPVRAPVHAVGAGRTRTLRALVLVPFVVEVVS